MSLLAAVRFVDLNSVQPAAPFTNWSSAAPDIQAAVDVAVSGDEIVVASGVYEKGARAVDGMSSNRVAITKAVLVRSLSGPASAVIRGHQIPGPTLGDQAVRCVYLGAGACLAGFTLTGGATRNADGLAQERAGGGVWCASPGALVSNCVLEANAAMQGGGAFSGTLERCWVTRNSGYGSGGGAYQSRLRQCRLTGNWTPYTGGGATDSLLDNCLLVGNTANYAGGGASGGTLIHCTVTGNYAQGLGGGVYGALTSERWYDAVVNNCIVYFNSAANGANHASAFQNFCCTTPLPDRGLENIEADPLFFDRAGGDYRLQPQSPCINAGRNSHAISTNDLGGQPRRVGGTVDLGAYEFQQPGSAISYAWLQRYGLPLDGTLDHADLDGDGLENWQEWRCGTDPTNATSALRFLPPEVGPSGVQLAWTSTSQRTYTLERASSLNSSLLFQPVVSNLVGQGETTVYTDGELPSPGRSFYRVVVEE